MSKRKKNQDEEKVDSFTPLFLSLSIILLAFFIMLNSIAELESRRVTFALRSIQNAGSAGLGVFGSGVGLDKSSKNIGGKKASVMDVGMSHEVMMQSLSKWGDQNEWADAYEDERKLVITLSDSAIFDPGSDKLHPRVFKLLDQVGTLVMQVGIPLTVQGHSDATPGGGQSNWVLSAGRAAQVSQYLIDGVGVPLSLIDAEAFGQHRPVASNDTKEGRMKNRRVDLVFYKNKAI